MPAQVPPSVGGGPESDPVASPAVTAEEAARVLAVANEAAARAADVDAEQARATAAEAAEVSARAAAVAGEAAARTSDVDTEEARATAAEAAEVAARALAVANEATARAADVDDEMTRAQAAEVAESARASAAEAAEAAARATGDTNEANARAAAVLAEQTRAVAVEATYLARLDALDLALASTASLTELVANSTLSGDTNSAVSRPLFVAPFACRVKSLGFLSSGSGAGSGTNFWTFTLQRGHWNGAANEFTNIARKSNWNGDPLGGEQFIGFKSWTMDSVAWDNAAALLAKDDVLLLQQALTGAPAVLASVRHFTVRYEPV